jgi:hypothetical protein
MSCNCVEALCGIGGCVSCNKHDDASMMEELEYESRMMRARMERLEQENKHLHTLIDGLLLVTQAKDQDRVRIMESIWKGTIEKNG